MPDFTRMLRTGAILAALLSLLTACGGGSTPAVSGGSGSPAPGGSGPAGGSGDPPVVIQGIATPSSVSVVTATNAN